MQIYAKSASIQLDGYTMELSDCTFSLGSLPPIQKNSSAFEKEIDKLNSKLETKREGYGTEEELQEGAMVFNSMCNSWAENFEELIKNPFSDDLPKQIDRALLLKNTVNNHSRTLFCYVRHCGGLTHAVLSTLNLENTNPSTHHFQKISRLIAENMAQVASLLCPPLSDFLEYPWSIENE